MTRCMRGVPSFWLGRQSALTRKLSFIVDRAAVWEKLAEILFTNDAFTVIKGAKKTRNG